MAARRVFMLAKNIVRYNACNIVDIEEWNILTNAFFNDLSNLSIITMVWLLTKHYFLALIISNYTQIFQYSVINFGTFTLIIQYLFSYHTKLITYTLLQYIYANSYSVLDDLAKNEDVGPIYCHQNIWKYEWIIIKTFIPQTLNRVS